MLETLLNEVGRENFGEETRPGEKRYRGRPKVVETLFGPVRLLRDYFVGADGASRVPLDEKLGLIEGYSPALAKLMGRVAAQQSFEAASGDLKAYAGVEIGARAIARMAQILGPQMAQVRATADHPQAVPEIPVLYVEADGTGVPMRKSEVAGRKAKEGPGEAKTREVKLGCVFTQTGTDGEGDPLRDPDSTSYVATFESSDSFGSLLRREAFLRGFAAAREVVFIGDGACWVWELARVNFPQAICILDFFHAAEHLGSLAGAIYGADTPQAQKQGKLWRDLLKEDGIDEVIAQVRAALPDHPLARE